VLKILECVEEPEVEEHNEDIGETAVFIEQEGVKVFFPKPTRQDSFFPESITL
jgi:hypothetical protein